MHKNKANPPATTAAATWELTLAGTPPILRREREGAMATTRKTNSFPWMPLGVGATAVGLFASWRLLPAREWLESFSVWVASLGVLGGVLYALVYVAAALLFVPGIVLTIGAGVLFGLGWGMVIVSLASTTAAALAFLIARHVARRRVERLVMRDARFGAIDSAIAEKGWTIVALLRLSPLVPFSLSNYLYGLTSVPFLPYAAASWAGMLPGTLLYVYLGSAGRTLGTGGAKTPWEWALLGAGLAATAAVTVLLTRIARRQLAKGKRESAG